MGLGLFWKKAGPSSQQCLAEIKKELGVPGASRKGIGHSGTLDPFAEGLLCVGWNEGRKLLHPLGNMSKGYEAQMLIGLTSDTLDVDGELQIQDYPSFDGARLHELNDEMLASFLESKVGTFDQIPPQFSAKRIDGKRAYEWARMGEKKELSPKRVSILKAKHLGLQVEDFAGLKVAVWRFYVEVSSGCYIRGFARDWSRELVGVEGCLRKLVRCKIGPFEAREATTPRLFQAGDLEEFFEIRRLDRQSAEALRRFGRWKALPCKRPLLLINPFGEALAWCQAPGGQIGRVFNENPL